jgi:uncharacterized protein YjbI with pentapeptide repeats
MDRDEALRLLRAGREGIAEWNRRRDAGEGIPDLSRANLNDVDLSVATLKTATLSLANLSGANLSGADLSGADLAWADLSGADLSGADLIAADLSGALLGSADLSRAKVDLTSFATLDLSRARGLDSVNHVGPSTIGIDTLFKSRGNIPEVFLRGCGVPEELIRYLPAIIGSMRPIQFYSCFISYSTKDHEFAARLRANLQSNGVRCWYVPEDLKIGEKFRVGIDLSIRGHDKLLLVLSEHSVQSDWVAKEVETAMEQESRQKRTILFPIRLDDYVMTIDDGWPADIRRSRQLGDFLRWKNHNDYQKSFNRLLGDLQAEP